MNIKEQITTLLLSLIGSAFLAQSASAYEWIQAGNGGRGKDPVQAGYVENDTYFVCAGRTPNGFQAGHLGGSQSTCYVAWGNKHIGFNSYYVLQGTQDVQWIDRNIADPNKVIKLDPENGIPTLICKAPNGLPGKVVGGGLTNGVCYTSWGNSNSSHTNFKVLVRR
jgi:hypothetical protein